ncbi:hypothetical protein CPC735_007510 [Coccidioides posadasii C735 delta SOWgp]|uniref:Actin-related protein RO7 n=1 Tax=Coccidioides posadasii (strain C735) TaxID=222929 RepID=C5PA16_COCP7|nr:hypothetical protein CPC735_007510 [Coccidioides posadasii C735 delta SOWgp]EER26578.1 hypothetical protein CPC735_007510 [Coccidioides posadasii C735 delta SOWgp]|eukprot:XP_003068723.1 hypothetical protein CPC735_007510 [Coccidioides posadasii C735 delta SOWgp]
MGSKLHALAKIDAELFVTLRSTRNSQLTVMTTISSSSSGFDRRSSATDIRTSLRSSRTHAPASPHTPQQSRQMYSPYTGSPSPGSSFRHEEDSVIIEIGTRWLRAGFEGNSTPVCVVGFGPEEGRRVGDYRGWIRSPNQDSQKGKIAPTSIQNWLKSHELWRKDIRGLDVGLFEDKLERAIRELYNKYLLTDTGSSRLVLVLPSIVPHVLLSSLLSTIFHRWRYPAITLLPSSAMAAVAAGVRSALVVDIGWEETTVTALYEYREIQSKRSTRAMKLLMQQVGRFLTQVVRQEEGLTTTEDDTIDVSVDLCEEIMTRLAWCRTRTTTRQRPESEGAEDSHQTSALDDGDDSPNAAPGLSELVSLPLPVGNTMTYIDVPFLKFSELVEQALFAGGTTGRDWDDEDTPLDMLVYNSLRSLCPDVRGTCMSRIVFIGGGSNIPGLRQRIIEDVDTVIEKHQWSLTRGKVFEKGESRERGVNEKAGSDRPSNDVGTKASEQTPDTSFIDERFQRNSKDSTPHVHGVLRQVDSLGSWAGASLASSLKVKGLVEVEREKFLQHGFAGASRDHNISTSMDRRSGYGPSMARSGGDRSSWTLGEWA